MDKETIRRRCGWGIWRFCRMQSWRGSCSKDILEEDDRLEHWFATMRTTHIVPFSTETSSFPLSSSALLHIKNARQHDSGNYKCIASNAVGEEEIMIRVSVKGRTFSTGFFFESSGTLSNDSWVMTRGLFWWGLVGSFLSFLESGSFRQFSTRWSPVHQSSSWSSWCLQ